MTPTFWKYLITACNGSAFRLVAESDRDSVEKELEADPHLLKYHAKPQIERSITHRLSVRDLRHFARARTHKLEVNQMHDAVVTINNTSWPAYRRRNGTLVDLRITAANSEPQGFILFEDLLDQVPSGSNGSADQPTKQR